MQILLGSAGSRGDVMPILEIASEMKGRGHTVRVFVPGHFLDEAARRELPAERFATDSRGLMQNLDSGWRSAKRTADWARQAMEEQLELLLPATRDADAVVTMANEVGAPTLAEYLRIPHFRVCLIPCLPGDAPPPVQPLQNLPPLLNRLLWSGVELGTMNIFGKALNKKRKVLLLPEVRRFSDYAAGYSHNLLAMDPMLAPPCRGWKYPYSYVGYPFGGDDGDLSPQVEAFLGAGSPPIYIGFGSICLPNPEKTTEIILDALAVVGCRAILASGWTKLGVCKRPPENVLFLEDAPHKKLFPKMAGIIHHGGSGTTHNAARSGQPQAIIPQMLDQYFWGKRIFDLGIGPKPVPQTSLTKRKLVKIFRELSFPYHRRQARAVSELMRLDGIRNIADKIEGGVTKS